MSLRDVFNEVNFTVLVHPNHKLVQKGGEAFLEIMMLRIG
jgi:hypothetical protein